MDGWNTTFLLGRPIFRGYVSLPEGSVFFLNVEFSLSTVILGEGDPLNMMWRYRGIHQQSVHHKVVNRNQPDLQQNPGACSLGSQPELWMDPYGSSFLLTTKSPSG